MRLKSIGVILLIILMIVTAGCTSNDANATVEGESTQSVQSESDEASSEAGSEASSDEISQEPVSLSFFSTTYESKLETHTLQSESAALLHALGEIEVDDKGKFSIGYGPIDVESSVFFPGNAGTIEAQMEITDASWEGTYNSETKMGTGTYNFTYTLTGEEAGSDAEVTVYLKGDLSFAPAEFDQHKERLQLTLTGESSRVITIGGETSTVDEDDYMITYIYEAK